MVEYYSLFDTVEGQKEEKKKSSVQKQQRPGKVAGSGAKNRGCDFCPLNSVKGINKIIDLDKVTGKQIMVWAQNPNETENKTKQALTGEAGKFLWKYGAKVGLKREDCDIQYVVRCWTYKKNYLDQTESRPPKKEELHCCSIYSEEAVERNQKKARVHLVLGKVAAKALLRGEYRKDTKTFYSEKLEAWVICTYHPSFFFGREGMDSKLKEFIEALGAAVQKAGQSKGKFSYIEGQDYKRVAAKNLEEEFIRPIKEASAAGERISVDIEDDVNEQGENVIVCVGVSWKAGMSRQVFINHPELKQSEKAKSQKMAALTWLLENPDIKKCMQYGCYDVTKIRRLWGIRVRGYDHDTVYSEYLRFSFRRAFGLAATAETRFREFAGYKEILEPYKEEGKPFASFLKVPMDIITIYNGADCDLTKRIEISNRKKVNQALMEVFIQVAFQLARMEENGPIFDRKHDKLLESWIPAKLDEIRARLKRVAGKEKFNPNAPAQVAEVLYDKLHLDRKLDAKWLKDHFRSTDKDTMQLLGKHHAFPRDVQAYRVLAKKKGTYMDGYRRSAAKYDGRLRTAWMLTGTVTGRLRSGGGKDKSRCLVNLQNIHGSCEIECLLVSDENWRSLYNGWLKRKMEKSVL